MEGGRESTLNNEISSPLINELEIKVQQGKQYKGQK